MTAAAQAPAPASRPPGAPRPASRGPTGTVDLKIAAASTGIGAEARAQAEPAAADRPVAPAHSTVSTSPRLAPRARLVLIGRDGSDGVAYPLGPTTDIGRTEGTVLLGGDRFVSPRHARITFRTGSYFLRDLGSTNGVFFRVPFGGGLGSSVPEAAPEVAPEVATDASRNPSDSEQPLEDQDLFLIGQQVLRFEVVKGAEQGFGVASDNGTLLFGTPAAPRFARLAQRTVEGVVRDVFNIRKAETVLGRESGDIVFTDDPFLSRRHAILRVHGSGTGTDSPPKRFTLSDMGSSNGTFLKVLAEVPLRPGDQFRIGQQLFRFDLDGTKTGA